MKILGHKNLFYCVTNSTRNFHADRKSFTWHCQCHYEHYEHNYEHYEHHLHADMVENALDQMSGSLGSCPDSVTELLRPCPLAVLLGLHEETRKGQL